MCSQSNVLPQISGTMSWWALAMVLNPDVQKMAQAEIDAVVGRDRLPTMDDVDKLVYLQAMLKEVLRWHPVGPLGMQHTSSEVCGVSLCTIWCNHRD